VAQIVFLACADGAVGQEDERAIPDKAAYGVMGVDPRVASRRRVEFRARRSQFDGEDGVLMQRFGKAGGHHGSISGRRAR
jgi:hypothetical protein